MQFQKHLLRSLFDVKSSSWLPKGAIFYQLPRFSNSHYFIKCTPPCESLGLACGCTNTSANFWSSANCFCRSYFPNREGFRVQWKNKGLYVFCCSTICSRRRRNEERRGCSTASPRHTSCPLRKLRTKSHQLQVRLSRAMLKRTKMTPKWSTSSPSATQHVVHLIRRARMILLFFDIDSDGKLKQLLYLCSLQFVMCIVDSIVFVRFALWSMCHMNPLPATHKCYNSRPGNLCALNVGL